MDYTSLNGPLANPTQPTSNLLRGQRAMMHIPESSGGETFHPLFVIVHSCEESLLPICHIHGSSATIFFLITGKLEVKALEGKECLCTLTAEGEAAQLLALL